MQLNRKPKGARNALLGASKAGALVRSLLAWFGKNARALPWRHSRDPYAIWISEIMLQQTQVKTVIPYWRRWMRELPTVQSLACARPELVLKLWEGLGYYTRARNLQAAALVIVRRHRGRFPESFEEVLALPGIGRYTAGAICSIAFNQPTPVLDGNVMRVLARLFGVTGNPRAKQANARLWNLAEALVREAARQARPADKNCSLLNQALMELGAVICTPRQPKCLLCPLHRRCVAFRDDCVDRLPGVKARVTPIERRIVAFVVEKRSRYLVRQRPVGVVNARLWEFPNVEMDGHSASIMRRAAKLFGLRPIALKPLHRVRHSITRYRVIMDVVRVEFSDSQPKAWAQGRWCSPGQLERLAFPSAHRKILGMLTV